MLSETAVQILSLLSTGPKSRTELTESLGQIANRAGHFLRTVEQIRRLELAELTIPDKPRSKNQKMRITEKGIAWLARKGNGNV